MCPRPDPIGILWLYEAVHCRNEDIIRADGWLTNKVQDLVFDAHEVALSCVDWIQDLIQFTLKLHTMTG